MKESIPDFVFPSLDFCIEVKLLKNKSRLKKVIEEINADTTSYRTKYKHIFFVVYDTNGVIDNEDEFKYNIAGKQTYLRIIKH